MSSSVWGLTAEQWDALGSIGSLLGIGGLGVASVVAALEYRHRRATYDEQTRPYILVTSEPGQTSPTYIDIVVKNIGSTPAYDVGIVIEPPFVRAQEIDGHEMAKARVFSETIPFWPPGHEVRMHFDSHADRDGQDLADSHQATLTYSGRRRKWRKPKQYVDTLIIDLELGRGTVHATVYDLHHAVTALRAIQKTLSQSPLLKGSVEVTAESLAEHAQSQQQHRGEHQTADRLSQLRQSLRTPSLRPDDPIEQDE